MTPAPLSTLSVYKAKPFVRFARKARIRDADLWDAAMRANAGLVDADLGGGVIKQRIARKGEGKSGGSRTIILFSQGYRAVYMYGFEKKDLGNIDRQDLETFRVLAKAILGYSEDEIAKRVVDGALVQVREPEEDNGEEVSERRGRRDP